MLQIAIKKKVSRESWIVDSISNYTCSSRGFTLLELLVTLAVIAIIVTVANTPDLELSSAKKSFLNTSQTLQTELSNLRNEAMMRNTTTRMVMTSSAGVYTITTYYSASPTTTCTSAVGTQLVAAHNISVNVLYNITGATAMANTCFYRDGTSSGGVFTISPITVSTLLKSSVITITIATGYLDVATGYLTSGGALNVDIQ